MIIFIHLRAKIVSYVYNRNMISFRKIDKNDISRIRPYFTSSSRVCTKAIGVMYMWSDYFGTEIAEREGGILIKDELFGRDMFMTPRGERAAEGLAIIEKYEAEKGGELVFNSVDDEDLALLSSRYPAIEIKSYRDYSDYLYLASDLAEYKGKKYHGQKNHKNKFMREYPDFEFLPFGKESLPEVYDFLEEHKALAPRSKEELIEYDACRRLLDAMDQLDLLTALIRVNGKIVAFTVGEILNDTLIVHIEKALPQYSGVYPTICSLFAALHAQEVTYINREDDAGDIGLRTSKTQYHPIALLEKRMAICHFSRKLNLPALFTERLVIDGFSSSDMPAYAALATDEERNRYWGYDYKVDLGQDEPNAAHFEKVITEDAARGVCYSYKIADLTGSFVGEGVLYNFRVDGSAELGLRIVAGKAGKGYGREAYRALADAALALLPKLHSRCYKENLASKKMILSAGFTLVEEDEDMFYFERQGK